MKPKIQPFLAGMITAAVIGGLGVGALAASGAVTFNASNLQLNGQQISAKGENYTLPSGQQVPASITYTDETGGGTTYLPVRRIAELLGIDIGWDGTSGSVTVVGDVKTTGTKPTQDNAGDPDDGSEWSAEDEAAYQEFKGMWEISESAPSICLKENMVDELKTFIEARNQEVLRGYIARLDLEVYSLLGGQGELMGITYYASSSYNSIDDGIWGDSCLGVGQVLSGFLKESVLRNLDQIEN